MKWRNRDFWEIQVLELYEKKYKMSEMARVIGISSVTVGNIAKGLGLKFCLDDRDKEKIRELWERGVEGTEIAREVGCTAQTVYKVARELGLKARGCRGKKRREIKEMRELVIKRIREIVDESGIISLKELVQKIRSEINVAEETIKKYARGIEGYKVFHFSQGGICRSGKFKARQVINGLCVVRTGALIWREGDRRVVDYVASRIPRITSKGHALAVYRYISKILGGEITREIIEKAGYTYSKKYKKNL